MPQWKSPMGVRKSQRPEEAEHRIAEIPMQGRHRSGADAAAKAIAHDELGAATELGEEARSVRELVAVVGVSHQYVFAACREDAGVECRAVTADRNRNKARAMFLRDLLRTIC